MIEAQVQKTLGNAVVFTGNLVPLFGVLFWGWDIFSIFFLYWVENAIVGIFTLVMMAAYNAQRGIFAFIGGLFTMAFFVFHYGLFCMAHLAILTEIFGKEHLLHQNFQPQDVLPLLLSPQIQGFYFAIAGLALAQAVNCIGIYVTKYSKVPDVRYIMFSPYGRIVVLHIAILFGGLAAQALGEPMWALVVLIVVKTLYDMGVLKVATENKEAPIKIEVQNGGSSENS